MIDCKYIVQCAVDGLKMIADHYPSDSDKYKAYHQRAEALEMLGNKASASKS
jgi:hypothetical protein